MVAITLTLSALLAILFGLIILAWPKFLNLFVGLYLLLTGIVQLLGGLEFF